jgi:hypothetical protein
MEENQDNVAFYVSEENKPVIAKIDAVCKKEDRSRSYIIMKILEENVDKYLKR